MEIVKQIIRKGEELLARRSKKFNKEIIVNAEALENRVAIMESGMLEEFTIERTSEKQIVASIFKGKIKNLEPGLKAAFVDIGFEKTRSCTTGTSSLSRSTNASISSKRRKPSRRSRKRKSAKTTSHASTRPAPKSLCKSSKARSGTKGPRITTNISIPAASSC